MESLSTLSKELNNGIARMFQANMVREYTEAELLGERKRYFKNYDIKPDEYITEDYRLICKICNSPRYFQRNNFVVCTNCHCQQREVDREKDIERKRQRLQYFEKLKKLSLINGVYENAVFESLDLDRPEDFKNAVTRCKRYCENWNDVKQNGYGMYLYGDVGTGKTVLTACIANYLMRNKLVPVLFTNFLEIGKQIKSTFSHSNSLTESEFITKLTTVDLLIIDDIGTEIAVKNGERTWIQDKIYDIINSRYINRKPTIFTSNESLVNLVEKCGLMKKTVDRIAYMATARIKLEGSSYRLTEHEKQANLLF